MAGQLLLMSGFPLYPSIIICCLVSEIKEIVENGLEVSQIPELAKKAFSELRQINNVYELPRVVMFSPDLYGIVDRVATMSCVLFGIRFIFHFSSPIWSPLYKKVYAYFSQKDDLLTLDSLKIFIQSIRRSILKWQRVLQQTDPAEAHIDAMKREISLTCREMINKLRTLDQISPQEQREGRSAIDQLLGVLKGNVLKPLGARGDRQEETSNNGLNGDDDFLPFMKLSEAGFRVSDWNEVLAGLGWDQNLNGYLDLKLIEKGIFSRKDAENILAEISPEKRLQALKGLLLDVSAASPPTLWSRVKEVAKKVNRVADYLFAIGFHSLSLLTMFQADPIKWTLFGLIDPIYLTHNGLLTKVSVAEFARASFTGQLGWIIEAACPQRAFWNAIFYAAKTGGIRAIPQTLYNVYIA